MATNLGIDDRLLAKAQRVGGQRTKKATVTDALNEYIRRRQEERAREEVIKMFGTIDFNPSYNYKRQRRRR